MEPAGFVIPGLGVVGRGCNGLARCSWNRTPGAHHLQCMKSNRTQRLLKAKTFSLCVTNKEIAVKALALHWVSAGSFDSVY